MNPTPSPAPEAPELLPCAPVTHDDLHGTLLHLKKISSSVSINWGEDTDLWECSAVSGGQRFTINHASARIAAFELLEKLLSK